MAIVLTKLQHSQIEEKSKTKLQAFQRKIYLKAKSNPNYKFYCLYDKVFRTDVLTEALKRVKASRGSGGIDGIELSDLKGKEQEFLSGIQTELKTKTYRPKKLKEVQIPKRNGKMRILKIPTIKDRTVQMAVKLIIEPIFEADFEGCSFGYRPRRSAHQAITWLNRLLFWDTQRIKERAKIVKSIDLADCFNTLPHKEMLETIAKRIIDRQMLKLIKSFLRVGMMEESKDDDEKRGTPQGGVLSPLLANIYLDKLDKYWKRKKLESQMLRYADDIILVLNKQEQKEYESFISHIEQELKLKVNQEKCTTKTVWQGVEFLGFVLKRKISEKKKPCLAIEPSRDAQGRLKEKLRSLIRPRTPKGNQQIIQETNRILKGWQQYFDNIAMGNTRHRMNWFVRTRVAKMLRKRKKGTGWKDFEDRALYDEHGLYQMKNLNRIFNWN